LLSGESSSLSVHGVYCGVSRRLNDLSIEPGEDHDGQLIAAVATAVIGFRPFATHLLVQGQAIRTTLELLRRKDWTTMIYALLLNSRPLGVSLVGLV
jgi:hypothetical protein